MTIDEFDAARRAFQRRRPFLPFEVEFASGAAARVPHPEIIEKRGELYVLRLSAGRFTVFSASSVIRLNHLSNS